jgi:hypothetical protein
MNTVSESGRLHKESPVGERRGEVGDRLSFDHDRVVDQVVTSREPDHPHLEGASSSYRVEQRRVMFRMIDVKSVKLTGH